MSLLEGILLVARGQRGAERRCGQLLKETKEKGERDPGGRGKIASREDAKKGSGIREGRLSLHEMAHVMHLPVPRPPGFSPVMCMTITTLAGGQNASLRWSNDVVALEMWLRLIVGRFQSPRLPG